MTNINLEMILKNFYTLKGLQYDISKNIRQNIIALIPEAIDSSLREFITEDNCSNYDLNKDQYSQKLINVLDEKRLFIIMIYNQSIIAKNKKLDLWDKIFKFRYYNNYFDNNINTNFKENFNILKKFFSTNKITIISNEVIYSFLYLKTEKLKKSIRILNQINEEDKESIINLFFNLDLDIIQTLLINDYTYNDEDDGKLNLILDHLNQKKCQNKSQNIELIKLFFGLEKEKLENYSYSLCNLIKKLDYEDLKNFFNSDAIKVLIKYNQLYVIDDIIDELPKISDAIQRFISSIENMMMIPERRVKFFDHLKSITNDVKGKDNIEELKYLLLFKYYKAKTSDILRLDPFISKIKTLNDPKLLPKFMKIDSENIYKISKFYGNDLLKLKEELFDEFFSIIERPDYISQKLFNLEIKLIYKEDKNYSSYLDDVLVKKREIKDINIFINIIKCLKKYYKKKFNNQKQDDEINFIKKIIENKSSFISLQLLARQDLLEKFLSFEKNSINYDLLNKYSFMSLQLLATQDLLKKFFSFEENLINYDLFNKSSFKIIANLYHRKTLKLLFDCKGETINFFMEQYFKDNNLNLLVKNLYKQNLLEKFFEILKNNPELLKEAIKENDPNIINIINDYIPKNNIDLSSVNIGTSNITTLNPM